MSLVSSGTYSLSDYTNSNKIKSADRLFGVKGTKTHIHPSIHYTDPFQSNARSLMHETKLRYFTDVFAKKTEKKCAKDEMISPLTMNN